MSDLSQVSAPSKEAASKEAPKTETLTFPQYKQRLKNDCEIAELRARIAKASFEELAAANQYNQLRAHLETAVQPQAPTSAPNPNGEDDFASEEVTDAYANQEVVVDQP